MPGKTDNKRGKTLTSLLAATDELIDAVQQFSDRFTAKGNTFSTREAVGKEAEVSVAIPAGGTGEVLVTLGKGLHNYPARGLTEDLEFKRGDRVCIRQLANQTLIVTKPDES
jgi:hypothetical protein